MKRSDPQRVPPDGQQQLLRRHDDLLHAAGQAGVPSGLGYGQADVQRVSGKSPVRHPGGFFRAAAGGPGRDGILTMPFYQTLPKAEITCLDYSPDMMAQAKEKADRLGLQNVSFRQGDVGALPFEDGSFDAVLSLNGFHAFPDKEAAYRETFRMLRPGGTFCGCFYVKDGFSRTDWFIRHAYEPAKFFTPPYETVTSLQARLNSLYETAKAGSLKGIAWFVCRKGEEER